MNATSHVADAAYADYAANAAFLGLEDEPAAPQPDYLAVPQELKDIPRWVVWAYEIRDGKKTKPPLDAKTGGYASTTDPSTWATFERAVKAFSDTNNGYDGIGFILTDTSLVGIDFDGAIQDKQVDPYAAAILELLRDSYCEISPSGKGLKVIVDCANAGITKGYKFGRGNHVGIEIYDRTSPRFFTITGRRFSGSGVSKLDDIALPYFLVQQSKSEKFRRLWVGDATLWDKTAKSEDDPLAGTYPSQSEADQALCSLLAPLMNYEYARIDAAFLASKLAQRDKAQRADYRRSTILKAIGNHKSQAATETNPGQPSSDIEFNSDPRPESRIKHGLEPLPQRGDGWFDIGGVSLLGGSSGVGKTTFMFELLHKQKQGHPFLGHQTNKLIFHVLTVDRPPAAYDATIARLGLLPTDIPRTQLPMVHDLAAAQVIFDEVQKMNPIPNVVFVEGLDMLSSNQNDKVRVSIFMRHLQDVAKHLQVSIIGSVGASKVKRGQEYGHKRDQIAGSEAWGRLADTVVVLSFSEEDDGTGDRREMSVLLREASAERFSLQFEEGRLVPIQAAPPNEHHGGGRPAKNLPKAVAFLKRKLQANPAGAMLQTLLRDALEEDNISRPRLYEAADYMGIDREHAEEVKLPNGRITRLWKLASGQHGGVPADEEVTTRFTITGLAEEEITL